MENQTIYDKKSTMKKVIESLMGGFTVATFVIMVINWKLKEALIPLSIGIVWAMIVLGMIFLLDSPRFKKIKMLDAFAFRILSACFFIGLYNYAEKISLFNPDFFGYLYNFFGTKGLLAMAMIYVLMFLVDLISSARGSSSGDYYLIMVFICLFASAIELHEGNLESSGFFTLFGIFFYALSIIPTTIQHFLEKKGEIKYQSQVFIAKIQK